MAEKAGAPREKISAFKTLAVKAAVEVAGGQPGFGMLLDDSYGREAIFDAAKHPLWIARPVEIPGSRPIRFEGGPDLGSRLVEWPAAHTIKCLVFYHPDDDPWLKSEQIRRMRGLYEAARRLGRELLIEVVAGRHGSMDDSTLARAVRDLYGGGIRPDWWKLEPQATAEAWKNIEATIAKHDKWCRGVVVLGQDAPEAALERAFQVAAGAGIVKGFAVGRTIFSRPARQWLAGEIADDVAVAEMAKRFASLVELWRRAQSGQAEMRRAGAE
jgi:5-dehydro-2-deoxygluconokinase